MNRNLEPLIACLLPPDVCLNGLAKRNVELVGQEGGPVIMKWGCEGRCAKGRSKGQSVVLGASGEFDRIVGRCLVRCPEILAASFVWVQS